jgi:hypothetical protein
LIGFGLPDENAHAPNEWLDLEIINWELSAQSIYMKNLHKTKLHIAFLISCLTITAIPITIQAQEQNSPIISDIVVEGYKITKEYIIRREIHHPVNAPYDSVLAVEDKNRIDNLGIFSTVEVMLLPDKEGAQILSYKVVESWRIFPSPIII